MVEWMIEGIKLIEIVVLGVFKNNSVCEFDLVLDQIWEILDFGESEW